MIIKFNKYPPFMIFLGVVFLYSLVKSIDNISQGLVSISVTVLLFLAGWILGIIVKRIFGEE